MNLTSNNPTGPAVHGKAAAPAANDAATALASNAADAATPGKDAVDGVQDGAPQPAQPPLAFAQWLGLEQLAPVAGEAAATAMPEATAPEAASAPDERQATADTPLLGAMTMAMPLMPMMPPAQATLAAVVAALPGMPSNKEAAPAAHSGDASSTAAPVAYRADAALPVAGGAPAPAPAPAMASNSPVAAAALPAESRAGAEAPQDAAAPAVERGAANTAGIAAPAPGTAQRTADTVTLSGPPTAWRQTLQEALGDRLQLQLGKNAEQAVIRLEPPMLGRVEIAIRHSAGSLEVHITATHGEVLRQLQTVSENLRSDLAQRQFTDVAVNVTAAPRAASANNMNMFAGDGNGRGRQQDGGHDEQQPGNALAEANTGASPFSLNAPANRRA